MNIAGYQFQLFKSPPSSSGPGIFIYIHKATGKCFVRSMRNIRMQRGENNYPAQLKELLKTNASEVLVYVTDVLNNTKEVLSSASNIVRTDLTLKKVLYKGQKLKQYDAHHISNGGADGFTVWKLTHKLTKAVYYFKEVRNDRVMGKISQRMLTFNNHVLKNVSGANRVMHSFAMKFFPLDIEHWYYEDLCLNLPTEQAAEACITSLSKKHLENKEVVLNRISGHDALYYHNAVMKMTHIGIDEYLK
jgi:hypothetical protein